VGTGVAVGVGSGAAGSPGAGNVPWTGGVITAAGAGGASSRMRVLQTRQLLRSERSRTRRLESAQAIRRYSLAANDAGVLTRLVARCVRPRLIAGVASVARTRSFESALPSRER
jgi:hypothetical protein